MMMMKNTFDFWRHCYYFSCGGGTISAQRRRPYLQPRQSMILSSSFSSSKSNGYYRYYYYHSSRSGVAVASATIMMMMLTALYWYDDDNIDGEKEDPEQLSSFLPLLYNASSSSSSSLFPFQRQRKAATFLACPTGVKEPIRPLHGVGSLSLFVDTFMSLTNKKNDVCTCEALATAQHSVETINNNSRNSDVAVDEWNYYNIDKRLYERMPVPDRALVTSHVIYGQLLQKDLVESYTVYRLKQQVNNNHVVDEKRNSITSNNNNTVDIMDAPQPQPVVMAAISLGKSLNGHDGIVHGGVLALLMDDVLGFGYEALGSNIAMAVTANLTINFRTPCPASSDICIDAYLLERTGRKLIWKVQVTSPDKSILYCEGTSVYVIPKKHCAVV